jgi:hypothetical protein
MAHFAQVDNNNIVIRVLVVDNYDILKDSIKNNHPEITRHTLKSIRGEGNITIDGQSVLWEDKDKGKQYLKSLYGGNTKWYKTSYNGNYRKNFAGIGYTYDNQRDAFIPPKPYPSWTLNEDTCNWESPVPFPQDGKMYQWNEITQQWIEA